VLPEPRDYDSLPTVTRLRSRPVASFKANGAIWEIGWNGVWVKAWARLAPTPAQGSAATMAHGAVERQC
jgi:hypothetical protein